MEKLKKQANQKAIEILAVLEKENRTAYFSQLLLQQLEGLIASAFMSKRIVMKVSEVDPLKNVNIPESKEKKIVKDIIDIVKDLPVMEAEKIISSIGNIIEKKISLVGRVKLIKEFEIKFDEQNKTNNS